jgi:5-aminolevulinate synthase
LSRHSIYIQPINYPTVPIGKERLRITPTPHHKEVHVSALVEAFVDVWNTLGLPFSPARVLTLREPGRKLECVYPTMRKAAE